MMGVYPDSGMLGCEEEGWMKNGLSGLSRFGSVILDACRQVKTVEGRTSRFSVQVGRRSKIC
jgi:hypothetical protein